MIELGFAGFLLAHGGIHVSFLSPRPAPKPGAPAWPFDATHSWILTPLGVSAATLRVMGFALVAVTVAGYALSALGVLGLVAPDITAAAVVLASIASLAILGIFFHPWLIVGVAIDIVLVWLALTRSVSAGIN